MRTSDNCLVAMNDYLSLFKSYYSYVQNKRGGQNNQGGWEGLLKSNKRGGQNKRVGVKVKLLTKIHRTKETPIYRGS